MVDRLTMLVLGLCLTLVPDRSPGQGVAEQAKPPVAANDADWRAEGPRVPWLRVAAMPLRRGWKP